MTSAITHFPCAFKAVNYHTILTLALQARRVRILVSTRVIFYVHREVDLMKTGNVNAYIMHIFGKIELLSIHAT